MTPLSDSVDQTIEFLLGCLIVAECVRGRGSILFSLSRHRHRAIDLQAARGMSTEAASFWVVVIPGIAYILVGTPVTLLAAYRGHSTRVSAVAAALVCLAQALLVFVWAVPPQAAAVIQVWGGWLLLLLGWLDLNVGAVVATDTCARWALPGGRHNGAHGVHRECAAGPHHEPCRDGVRVRGRVRAAGGCDGGDHWRERGAARRRVRGECV